jgi:Urocanase Rossmann-like domain
MLSHSNPDQTQPRILRTFTTLHSLRPAWSGQLILSLGLDPVGAALSIAANIAGAVSLAIDNNPARIREVVRTGAVDFVVNTLDEAVRAMKNEVRKHAPLSIALYADPFVTLTEIQDRGLAPQLFSNLLSTTDYTSEQAHTLTQAAHQLQTDGALLIDFTDETPANSITSSGKLLASFLNGRNWSLQTFTFDTVSALRSFDVKALHLLSSDDPQETLRCRWLEAAPRILQRQRPPQRSIWLTPSEEATLSNSGETP